MVLAVSPNKDGLPWDKIGLNVAQVWTRFGTFSVSADFRNPSLLLTSVDMKAPAVKSVVNARDFWICFQRASTTSGSWAGSFWTSLTVDRSQSRVDKVLRDLRSRTSVSASFATGTVGSADCLRYDNSSGVGFAV